MKKLISATLIAVLCLGMTACGGNGGKFVPNDSDAYYRSELVNPFWLSDTMVDESLLPVQFKEGEKPYGYLAYYPEKILKVTNYAKTITYSEGTDFVMEGGKLILTEGTKIPNLKYSDLIGNKPLGLGAMPGYESYTQYSSEAYRSDGMYIYYNEYNSILTANQILVTYEYDNTKVVNTQGYQGDKLPETMKKLRNGDPINMLVYGDSIGVGCNASGYLNEPPYQDTWFEMFKKGLESRYKSKITLSNTAVGGTTTLWGCGDVDFSATVKADIKANAIDKNPDLVILHWSLNDATMKMETKDFIANMKKIVDRIRAGLDKTVEFIIISPFNTSPLSAMNTGKHFEYVEPLKEYCEETEGIIHVNISAIHSEVCDVKFYADCLSNNINHPNDWICRIYAMNLLASTIEYDKNLEV